MPELMRAGARVHFEVHGAGPPLVVLHGFTGSGLDFLPLAAALRRRVMTVTVDLMGHGDSDAPQDPQRYSLDESVKDTLAVADALGLERFDLLGYSLGGRVALRVALKAPQRVLRLVLESSSPGIRDADERRRRRDSDRALAQSLEADGLPAFVERWLALDLFRTQRLLPAARQQAVREAKLRQRPQGLAYSLLGAGAGMDEDVWESLGEIRGRVLLIGGMADQKYGRILAEMAERLPDARLVRVPRVGHTVHLERPRLFAQYVGEFLRQP